MLFAFKYFQSTPLEKEFFQLHAIFLATLVLFLVGHFLGHLITRKNFTRYELYFITLIAFVPIYSASRAYLEFGQPVMYGLLSERGWVTLGLGILFYNSITKGKTTLNTFEKSFVLLAWFSLTVFTYFYMFADIGSFGENEVFAYVTAERGVRFKFASAFISFGAIYYFIRFTLFNLNKDLIKLLLFLCYIIFLVQGRTLTFAIIATFVVFIYCNRNIIKSLSPIIKITSVFAIGIIALFIFQQAFLSKTYVLFAQMLQVLLGKESLDISANARLNEAEIVLSYFKQHPYSFFFGIGNISNQWNEGYKSIFGYFYPADIGILGGIFIYGLFGFVLIALIPLIFTIKIISKYNCNENPFLKSLKYILVFNLLIFFQGSFIFNPITYLIPYFIILAFYQRQKYDKNIV